MAGVIASRTGTIALSPRAAACIGQPPAAVMPTLVNMRRSRPVLALGLADYA